MFYSVSCTELFISLAFNMTLVQGLHIHVCQHWQTDFLDLITHLVCVFACKGKSQSLNLPIFKSSTVLGYNNFSPLITLCQNSKEIIKKSCCFLDYDKSFLNTKMLNIRLWQIKTNTLLSLILSWLSSNFASNIEWIN